jgi:hypothetical protein
MLRRSWFPLCAWLVLLVSVLALYASPHHQRIPDSDGVQTPKKSTHTFDFHPSLGASGRHVEAPSQMASTGNPPSASEQPKGSGWSFGGARDWWLQKIIDARRSWTGTSGVPALATTAGSAHDGGSGSGTGGHPIAATKHGGGSGTGITAGSTSGGGGSGSGTDSHTVAASGGGGSGTSTTTGTTAGGSGSGTGTGTVPVSAGSGPVTDNSMAGALGGATSGSGYSGGTSTGTGSGDSASAPPPSGQGRDPASWPFAPTSPWNYPIGSNARYVGFNWRGNPGRQGSPNIGINPNVSIVWVGSSSDPMTRIIYNNMTFTQNVPASARSTGGEFFITFVRADHLAAIDGYYGQKQADGSWTVGGALINVDLKGKGYDLFTMCLPGACNGQTRAAGVPEFAGSIRPGELTNGIPHALAFVVGGTYLNKTPWGGGWVWPAVTADDDWQTTYNGQDLTNLYMGSMIAIPPSVDINSLGLVRQESINIAKALQQYGGYTVDRGDYGTMECIIDTQATEWIPWYNDPNRDSDMKKISAVIRIVANSSNPTDGTAPRNGVKLDGGDGSLRIPLAPSF